MGVPHSTPNVPKFETAAIPPVCISGEMRRFRARSTKLLILGRKIDERSLVRRANDGNHDSVLGFNGYADVDRI